ncbi:MAG TPA: type VI secretion system-associated protein TagF, partial [Rhodocyclaceae bacterium]|nr:type VI secretion system-associated protein TagF [Rhodocyclaceae bacterium]
MNDRHEGVPGWYGKIASLGDFASRRLSPDFISRWDGWLQQVMSASRGHLGEAWLNAYLTSPVWRFILFPGVCGESSWVGVFMPSVDKVGRYFPITVACETPAFATTEREFNALADWLDRIESLALSTLDRTRSAQQFDDALLGLRMPSAAPPRVALARQLVGVLRSDEAALFTLPSDDELAQTLMGAGASVLRDAVRGGSL